MYWQQHPSTHLHQKPLPQSRRHHRSPRWREAPRRLVKHGGMNQQKWRCRQSYAGEILQWWFLLSWKIENNQDFTSKLSNFWNHHWGDCTNKSGFQKYWFSSAMFLQFQRNNQTTITTPRSQQKPSRSMWFSTTQPSNCLEFRWFRGSSVDLLTWSQGQRIGVQKHQAFVARQAPQQELGPIVDGANATYRWLLRCDSRWLWYVVVKTMP